MILTDYYRGQRLTIAKSRYEVTASTEEYDLFERVLINKLKFNIGGLSFNCIKRPQDWKGSRVDMAITKGSQNITTVKRPNIESNLAYGDINGSNDACIIVFNADFKDVGLHTIEIFIARGLKYDTDALWNLFVDGELSHEIKLLKSRAVTKFVTKDVGDNPNNH